MRGEESVETDLFWDQDKKSCGRIKFYGDNSAKIRFHEDRTQEEIARAIMATDMAEGISVSYRHRRASHYPTFTPPEPKVSIDEDKFISYWASELKKIYDNQTAGDYTFEGVVSKILRDFTNPQVPDLIIHRKWEVL